MMSPLKPARRVHLGLNERLIASLVISQIPIAIKVDNVAPLSSVLLALPAEIPAAAEEPIGIMAGPHAIEGRPDGQGRRGDAQPNLALVDGHNAEQADRVV